MDIKPNSVIGYTALNDAGFDPKKVYYAIVADVLPGPTPQVVVQQNGKPGLVDTTMTKPTVNLAVLDSQGRWHSKQHVVVLADGDVVPGKGSYAAYEGRKPAAPPVAAVVPPAVTPPSVAAPALPAPVVAPSPSPAPSPPAAS